jgi:hypothetical protein
MWTCYLNTPRKTQWKFNLWEKSLAKVLHIYIHEIWDYVWILNSSKLSLAPINLNISPVSHILFYPLLLLCLLSKLSQARQDLNHAIPLWYNLWKTTSMTNFCILYTSTLIFREYILVNLPYFSLVVLFFLFLFF